MAYHSLREQTNMEKTKKQNNTKRKRTLTMRKIWVSTVVLSSDRFQLTFKPTCQVKNYWRCSCQMCIRTIQEHMWRKK